MADACDAEIDAVTPWEYPASFGMGGPAGGVGSGRRRDRCSRDALKAAFGDDRPAGLRTVVRKGHPAKALSDAADGAEMLVVGSRGHGGFAGLLLGSVSAYCTAHSPCPVLVTRTVPPASAGEQAPVGAP